MRGIPGLARMILVALSGYGRVEDQRESRDAGFDHHLVKPVDFRIVGNLLDNLASARLLEKSRGLLH